MPDQTLPRISWQPAALQRFRAQMAAVGEAFARLQEQLRAVFLPLFPALERPVDRARRQQVDRMMRTRARRAARRTRRAAARA